MSKVKGQHYKIKSPAIEASLYFYENADDNLTVDKMGIKMSTEKY